jgi:hypothetical protein
MKYVNQWSIRNIVYDYVYYMDICTVCIAQNQTRFNVLVHTIKTRIIVVKLYDFL